MNQIPSIPNSYPRADILDGTISKDFQIANAFRISLESIGSYLFDHQQIWTVIFNIFSFAISLIK